MPNNCNHGLDLLQVSVKVFRFPQMKPVVIGSTNSFIDYFMTFWNN